MSKSINIRDFDSVNEFCEMIADRLFPAIREDINKGESLDDMYATLLDKMGRKKTVSKKDVMWASFVTTFAISRKILAEEKAGMFAT